MAELVCQRCSHPNSVVANFCSSCGFDLTRPAVDATGQHTIEMVPADHETSETCAVGPSAMFVVKRGAKAGSRFVVDSPIVTLGRHPESHIFLDDVTVSRRHAEVRREGDAYLVVDVGSLNGTYLNRERIEQSQLTGGDELQVGKFKLVFLLGEEA